MALPVSESKPKSPQELTAAGGPGIQQQDPPLDIPVQQGAGEPAVLSIPEESISRLSRIEKIRPLTENSRILFGAFAAINVLLYHLILRSQGSEVMSNELLLGLFCVVSSVLGALTLVFSLSELFRSGFSALLRGKPSIDTSLMVALVVGMAAIVYSLIFDFQTLSRSGFADLYVLAAFLLTVWRFLASGYSEALGDSLGFDLRKYVSTVRLSSSQAEGEEAKKEVPYQSLKEGAQFELQAGDMVPTDATILKGTAQLNERKFGGKASSHVRTEGQTIFAGSRIVVGKLVCEALLRPEDATITNFSSKLKEVLVRSRQQAKELWKYAPVLNALLVFTAACSGVYWYQEGLTLLHTVELIMAVLFLAPLLQFVLIVPRLTGLLLTDLFMKGALVHSPETLHKLRKLERLTLYVHEDDTIGEPQATSFEILDSRVDEEGLRAVLLAILGAVDGDRERSLVQFLSKDSKVTPLLDVDDLTVYPGYGLCATVRGVEFSVGREGFLIDRGVQMTASEIGQDTETEEWLYIALGDALVARSKFMRAFYQDGRELHERLRALGIRCSLVSDSIDQKTLDHVGKITGLDLSQIHGGASLEELTRLCERGEGPLATYGTSTVPKELQAHGLSFRLFDTVLWDLKAGDVLLFDRNLSVLPKIVSAVRRFYRLRNVGVAVLAALSVVLLLSACLAAVPPLALLLSSMFAASAFGLLSFLFLPELPKAS